VTAPQDPSQDDAHGKAEQTVGSPKGPGQDPSEDVLRAGHPVTPVSAGVGEPSTDHDRSDSAKTANETGNLGGAPLAPSPGAVTAPAHEPRAGSDMFGATFGGDTSGFGGLVRQQPAALSSPRPYGGWFDETVDALQEAYPGFGEAITRVIVDRGELTLHVLPGRVAEVCQVLRDSQNHRFELLSSVSGVDYIDQPDRFHVVYHLTSMTYRRRIRLETAVPLDNAHVASVTRVYPTADFHERETWDMFGIVFDGHPGLTRILMPDDWQGHPQRKDYPLGGVPVEYKGAQIPPPDERRAYA
jgi:NADH-quinone oxidoreductase subunit C